MENVFAQLYKNRSAVVLIPNIKLHYIQLKLKFNEIEFHSNSNNNKVTYRFCVY